LQRKFLKKIHIIMFSVKVKYLSCFDLINTPVLVNSDYLLERERERERERDAQAYINIPNSR
jgi:hypothetical protein